MRVARKALTFDDVLLVPAHSEVVPREVSLATRLTRGVRDQHPGRVRRHGHGHRGAARDRDRAGGRDRHRPQEHVPGEAGRRGGQGQALRERGGQGSDHRHAVDDRARGAGTHAEAPHQRVAGGRGPARRRHRHQPRPALRDQPRPARVRDHDAGGAPRHGARGQRARLGQVADAPASAGARAGGQRRPRAAGPDHGQGHPEVDRASQCLQGRARTTARGRGGQRRLRQRGARGAPGRRGRRRARRRHRARPLAGRARSRAVGEAALPGRAGDRRQRRHGRRRARRSPTTAPTP